MVGGCCPNLNILRLSNNNFHGNFLSSHFNLTSLSILDVSNKKFSGTLSKALSRSFKRCTSTAMLDIGNNYISGEIPSWITNITGLESLIMRNNFCKGQLPSDLRFALFLDPSYNILSGTFPSRQNLLYSENIHLQGNKFTGSIPTAFLNSSSLLTLDVRDNSLSEIIPTAISAVSNLRILLLEWEPFEQFNSRAIVSTSWIF
jgi:hypothetical protein